MKKDEVLDLILKAAAVWMFVRAALALPSVVGGIAQMFLLSKATVSLMGSTPTAGDSMMAAGTIAGLVGIVNFAIYLIIGRNLFQGGSWLRRVFGGRPGIDMPVAQ